VVGRWVERGNRRRKVSKKRPDREGKCQKRPDRGVKEIY
jgi:hypothetical protein